jgi:hypothetical protein
VEGFALTGEWTMCSKQSDQRDIGLTDENFSIDSHRLQVLAKIRPASPLALPASAEPHVVVRPPEMAKKTFRDIPPFIGADSKVERRRGVASQKRNEPSLLLSPLSSPYLLLPG